MPVDPELVAGLALIESPSLNLPVKNPTLISIGGALNVIPAGSSTPSPIGGGSSPQAGNTVLANATGSTAVPTAVALDPTLVFTGGTLAVAVPLTLTSPLTGLQLVLALKTTDTSAGSPVLSWYTTTTETAHIRVDRMGIMTICSQIVGGSVRLFAAQEAAIRFECNLTGIGFYGTTPVAKQAQGAALTNGATGGTASTVSTFAGTTYATDAAAILGNFNQIAVKLNLIDAALKASGLVSS